MRLHFIGRILVLSFFLPFIISACSDKSLRKSDESQENALGYYQTGLLQLAKKKHEKAKRSLEKAIHADPSFLEAYLELSDLLIGRGKDQEAERCLLGVPDKVTKSSRYYYLLGSTQFHQTKINESIRNLEICFQSDSNNSDASWKLARLYFRLENYDYALEHLELLVKDTNVVDRQKIQSLYQKTVSILKAKDPRTEFEKNMESRFSRSETVTRGMLACVFVIEFGLKNSGGSSAIKFTDVDSSVNLFSYYQKAVSEQFLETLPDGKFYPGHIITRRNLAHYLNKLMNRFDHLDLPVSNPERRIIDVSSGDPQHTAMNIVCRWNLMSLDNNARFYPDEPVTGKELMHSIRQFKKLIGR
jgi:Tfp pilus assembly protein PilF